MPERRRSRTLLAVLTLVALALITLDYRQGDDGVLAAAQRGAVVAFAPVQEGFSQVVRPVGSFFSAIGQLGSLRSENAALEAEIAELNEEMPSVANLERENEELRELLGMRDRLEVTTTAARVIGQPPGEQGNSVLIDAGADQGIEVGMAVLSARGLVGKIVEATASHARVELLTSPTARYAVRIAESGETGLLRGQGAEPFQLELLDPEAEAPDGAEVVTRTFQASTIPDGLPVGEIAPQREDGGDSPRFSRVRPYVDFRRLSIVQVVLDAPEAPERLDPDELIDSEPDVPRPRLDSDDDSDPDADPDADGTDDGDVSDPEEDDEAAGDG